MAGVERAAFLAPDSDLHPSPEGRAYCRHRAILGF